MYLSISTPASSEAQCQNVMVTGCVPSRLSTGAASSSAGAAVGSAGAAVGSAGAGAPCAAAGGQRENKRQSQKQ